MKTFKQLKQSINKQKRNINPAINSLFHDSTKPTKNIKSNKGYMIKGELK